MSSETENDGFGDAERQNGLNPATVDKTQPASITILPQHYYRNQFASHAEQNSEDLMNYFKVGKSAYSDKTFGQNNINPKSWTINAYHIDPNPKLAPGDCVVINVDDNSQPSTSYSGDNHDVYVGMILPQQCQIDLSASNNDHDLDTDISAATLNDHDLDTDISVTTNIDQDLDSDGNNSGFLTDNSDVLYTENNESPNNRGLLNNNCILAVADNIERNRSRNRDSRSSDGCSLDKILNKYTPFVTFLLIKAVYDHKEGILIFIGLLITFIHANAIIKREVGKQGHRSPVSLGIITINLIVSISLIYFVFQDEQLYKNLIFLPTSFQLLTLWDVLWIVGVTDFVLKFVTMLLKVGIICFPGKWLPYAIRGKWFLLLERASQLYRSLIPIQPWLNYLMRVYQETNTVGIFFCIGYISLKGPDIKSRAKLFIKAFWKFLHHTSVGTLPSREQMITAGSQCPICHDDYNAPIMLKCRHVFCESCVSVWFDREQTCPLCRAKIAGDPIWRDGATSLFVRFF